jgi:hypothetical protein
MWSLISRGSGQIQEERRLVSAPSDVSFAAVQLPPGDPPSEVSDCSWLLSLLEMDWWLLTENDISVMWVYEALP